MQMKPSDISNDHMTEFCHKGEHGSSLPCPERTSSLITCIELHHRLLIKILYKNIPTGLFKTGDFLIIWPHMQKQGIS